MVNSSRVRGSSTLRFSRLDSLVGIDPLRKFGSVFSMTGVDPQETWIGGPRNSGWKHCGERETDLCASVDSR